ncbi:MAG: folate family ECF transporter S component [Traorella sp.]
MNLFSLIKRSAKGLTKVTNLVGTSMFVALNVILGYFKIVLVPNVLEIGFSTLAYAGCAYTYGPVMTGLAGILCDNIKYFLNPSGAYMPLFGLNEFLTGFIYGCFFYKKEIKLWRIICARLLVVVLVNIVLTPLWLHLLYGKAYLVLVQARLLKNVLLFPFDVCLLYIVLNATKRAIPNQIFQKA